MTLAYNLSLAAEKAAKKAAKKASEEGITLGIQQAKLETAKSMKAEKMPVSMIAHFTGLSTKEIEKL